MKVKYQDIEKGHRGLVEFISALPQLKKNSRGKYDEFFKGIEYRSWEEFNSAIEELNKYLEDEGIISGNKPHLYRGQCCGKWKLETTLERYTGKTYTVENYLKLIQSAKLAFDSHFGKGYKTEEANPIKAEFSLPAPHPHYSLLTYFRHLGFPSPLLDWTRSLYIAAYFAFSDAIPKNNKYVAIYSYSEYFGEPKGINFKRFVSTLGDNIPSHKRHYLQQAVYTYALSVKGKLSKGFKVDCDKVSYFDHYKAIRESMSGWGDQDVLIKHLIPITEKDKVLRYLYSHNINEYSLFHTEESLMKTVAYKNIR
jgi:hypothetical protein